MKIFTKYCTKVGANPKTCHPNIVANFVAELVRDKDLSYQTICGYRSAIARQHDGVDGVPLGALPQIKRLVRAVFVEKPPQPRYAAVWDVDKVLTHLEAGPNTADLSDMELSVKTATLTFILTLSRFTII